ncbi:helix-turn-helix domain-containing protein [Corynebacterium ulceribovis]|uniref:helix-turn-helix domain-containing protein n=1 Tax=Corynebacterium ulceribovis TaxID=487732 RepID=UPI00058CC2E2|nr:helix-turn-helix transcriptional regulator [Corynebacterium ulceribovis]
MNEWVRVGETLRFFRTIRGFETGEFANRLGITQVHLNNIEKGRRKLTNSVLARAAETLACKQIAIMIPRDDQPAIPDIDYRDPNHKRTITYQRT